MTNNEIMPPFAVLEFLYNDECLATLPMFVFFPPINWPEPYTGSLLDKMDWWQDHLAQSSEQETSCHVGELQKYVRWAGVEKFLSMPISLKAQFGAVWQSGSLRSDAVRFKFAPIPFPRILYRYMRFDAERIQILLREGKLFFPCPAMFNDPLDSGLDESVRLRFIEVAMASCSYNGDNFPMFSHYADRHTGLCVGFDTHELISSLRQRNANAAGSDVRPVHYLPVAPPLRLKDQPALCATCKADVWSYEKEARVFLSGPKGLLPSGLYDYDRTAIREIIYGCRATYDTIASCKTLTADLGQCVHKKAVHMDGSFGLRLDSILRR